MPFGSGWDAWNSSLEDGCAKLAAYAPDVVVVSLGVDTFEKALSHLNYSDPDPMRSNWWNAILNPIRAATFRAARVDVQLGEHCGLTTSGGAGL